MSIDGPSAVPLPFHRLAIKDADELKSLTEIVNSTLACIAEDGQAATHLLRLQKLLNEACKRKGIVPDDLLNTSEAETETPEMKQAQVDFYAPRMQSDPPED